VCNGHPGMSEMTTPAEFQVNVLASLDFLEGTLPAGSHVVFLPLADGRVLYDAWVLFGRARARRAPPPQSGPPFNLTPHGTHTHTRPHPRTLTATEPPT
jgi:hypothetical protein